MVGRSLSAGLLVAFAVARVHAAASITCPPSQQKNADDGVCSAIVTYPDPAVGMGIPLGCAPTSGSSFPVGNTTVSCSAFDAGPPPDVVTCAFNVQVRDFQAPSVLCPEDIVTGTEPGLADRGQRRLEDRDHHGRGYVQQHRDVLLLVAAPAESHTIAATTRASAG